MGNYGLIQTVAPTIEPLTLDEVKLFLRVNHSAEDALINDLIRESRERCERVTGRQLLLATYQLTLDDFPLGTGSLILPRPPLVEVLSITYIDTDGVSQTVSPTVYVADTQRQPGWLLLAYGHVWPATLVAANAVTITYRAGYASASQVPSEYRNRLRQCVAHCYANREMTDELKLDGLFQSLWCGTY